MEHYLNIREDETQMGHGGLLPCGVSTLHIRMYSIGSPYPMEIVDRKVLETPGVFFQLQLAFQLRMLRVRPPQLTITLVSGDGTRSVKRYTSSAPGTLMAHGMLLL
jgi:hypothetical protein